jgi:hypothetical protein
MGYEAHRSRRRRPLRRVLLLAGVALLVCCVGAAGLGAWNLQSVRRSSGPARQAVDAFLTDVAAGDRVRAYDRLCAGTRARWSREEFDRRFSASPRISRHAIEDVSVATRQGQLRGTVTATLTLDSGLVDRRELAVVQEGDGWRVCGDPL